jgi:integral membrane sensor domain MASE1
MKNKEPRIHFFARLLGLAMVYAATAIGGLAYAVVDSTVTLVWAPSGIALAALLAWGYRMAFGVALGAFLANAWTGIPLLAAAGIATGNTLEALAGAFLLHRLAHFHSTLDRHRDVLALIVLAAFFSTMLDVLDAGRPGA